MISFLVWDENSKFTLHILKLLRDFFKWIFETKLDFFLTLCEVPTWFQNKTENDLIMQKNPPSLSYSPLSFGEYSHKKSGSAVKKYQIVQHYSAELLRHSTQ